MSADTGRTIDDPSIRRQLVTTPEGEVAPTQEIGDHTFLADGYVYGIVTQPGEQALMIEAPLDDSAVIVELRIDPATTELHSLYGPGLAEIPAGARVEAYTVPLDGASGQLGPRLAIWLNVNPVYTHGDVVANENGVIVVNQAHGGTQRRLHPGPRTRLRSHQHGETTDFALLKPGDYVFFTSLARSHELDCVDLEPVVMDHSGATDSAETANHEAQ